jgi:hypothetical protein
VAEAIHLMADRKQRETERGQDKKISFKDTSLVTTFNSFHCLLIVVQILNLFKDSTTD